MRNNGRNTNKGLTNKEKCLISNTRHFIRAIKDAHKVLCQNHELADKVSLYWIDDKVYFGDYGYLGKLSGNKIADHWNCKKFDQQRARFLHDLACRTDIELYWFTNYDGPDYDGPNKNYNKVDTIFMFKNTSTIISSERYSKDFIKMSNGQLFDIDNRYWFTVSDSKILNEWLEDGYHYWDPQSFFQDLDEENY